MTPETIPDATGSTPVAWQDGQPFSPRYGDRYHTQSGARAQAEHVFLGGCGLPDAWSCRSPETARHDQECGTSGGTPCLDNDRNADTTTAPSGPACWTILETGFGLGLTSCRPGPAGRPVRHARPRCASSAPRRTRSAPRTSAVPAPMIHGCIRWPSAWPTPGRIPQHWPHGTRETPPTRLPVTPMPNRKHPERIARPREANPSPCHPVCRIPPLRMHRKRRPA